MIEAAADLTLVTPMASRSRVPRPVVSALGTVTFLIVIASMVLLTPQKVPADVASAVQKYNQGQREVAIGELVTLAETGDSNAMYTLGMIYAQGKGIPADPKKAAKWFAAGANAGNASAQFSLGVMNAAGEGIPQNAVVGLMWLNISRQDPNRHPFLKMKTVSVETNIKKFLTPEQIREAARLAAEWKPGR